MGFLADLNIPVIENKVDFTEAMRALYASVAFSNNTDIAYERANTYKLARIAFKAAIADTYPEVPFEDIYTIWVDCNETVAYCVEWYKTNKRAESVNEVEGAIDHIGDHLDRGHSL